MFDTKTDSTSWRCEQILDHGSLQYTSHTADKHILVCAKRGRIDNRLDAVQRLIALNLTSEVQSRSRNGGRTRKDCLTSGGSSEHGINLSEILGGTTLAGGTMTSSKSCLQISICNST